ncbi:MAG: aminotransferase class I/II-fold pyridoxal phosphate-dependent enzyme [Holophagales bacterium]|jgi:methionine-gamma-lyase|nr:aminotransferase class I/II-fold pyridoxal phosphate-dependent enzyme [Holophagales bacterium]
MQENHDIKPQTSIFNDGYDPRRSDGAVIPPLFRSSTYLFNDAEEGKRAFEIVYGISPAKEGETPAPIYSRVSNPTCEILEKRAIAWDGAEEAALFSSGMGAVTSTCLTFLKSGDTILFCEPIYGGTEHFFNNILPRFNINAKCFPIGAKTDVIDNIVKDDPTIKAIYLESPANPTMMVCNVPGTAEIAKKYSTPDKRILVIVDNTMMGPIFSSPLKLGADIVLYSATKFFGGHSDLIAGFSMGSRELITQIKTFRTILGSNSDPDTAWLIHRSLSTLQLRMENQQKTAARLAEFLLTHPSVEKVAYPGLPGMGQYQNELLKQQFTGSGSLICFCVKGGEAEAYRFLNAVKCIKLAVSLGGTTSLVEHPFTMTHSDMAAEQKLKAGITENLIRFSVGLEDTDDLIADLRQALEKIASPDKNG